MAVVDILFLVLTGVTIATLLTTFVYSVYLGLLTRRTRAGRILFGSISSLKLFVILVMCVFVLGVTTPGWMADHRHLIRWGLMLYLLMQSLSSLVALERLRRYGEY